MLLLFVPTTPWENETLGSNVPSTNAETISNERISFEQPIILHGNLSSILTILYLNYAHKFVAGKIAEKSPLIVKNIKFALMKDEMLVRFYFRPTSRIARLQKLFLQYLMA